ncbi:DUF3168 domain-containing protein [Pseudomonas sp. 21LCFQ010]|uniref:tail completion protein gp17 n=1 Tax=Pseudomonas sp. 21LCFQ010 TaxID=2957506 RepID=UPI0020983F18|nr:DUF3168 domain-containing protein [Pseudomonas sp. 21LCFQ010]MCO8164842.1 DUF3168 domain-containing protein [Pseudomonas sp. 21LCFQ010]
MIETHIAARLGALAGGHVYPEIAPPDAPVPRITWLGVGVATGWVLSGWDGSQDATLQIDAWAGNKLLALELANAVFEVMTRPGPGFTVGQAQRLPDDYESDTRLFRVSWEFMLQP